MTLQLHSRDLAIPVSSTADRSIVSTRASAAVMLVADTDPTSPVAASEAAHVIRPLSTELVQAVEKINRKLIESNIDLHFRVDDTTHETVVSVIDRESGDVLRQFPSEEALKFAHALVMQRGTLIAGTA